MELETLVRRSAEAALTPGQFIVDVAVSTKKGPGKVLVILDGDEGISIDDCAEISRKLSKALDEAGDFSEKYQLEVSTPGVDQPLKLLRQFRKNIGRKLKLKLTDNHLEGKLTEVKDQSVTIEEEIGSGKKKELRLHDVPFSAIEKAVVQVSFK